MTHYLQYSPLKFKACFLSFNKNNDVFEDTSRLNLNNEEIINSPIPSITRGRKSVISLIIFQFTGLKNKTKTKKQKPVNFVSLNLK